MIDIVVFAVISGFVIFYVLYVMVLTLLKTTPPFRNSRKIVFYGITDKMLFPKEFISKKDALYWVRHCRVCHNETAVVWKKLEKIKLVSETENKEI